MCHNVNLFEIHVHVYTCKCGDAIVLIWKLVDWLNASQKDVGKGLIKSRANGFIKSVDKLIEAVGMT